MATHVKGAMGAFKGKAGTVIGYINHGQNILTGLHEKSSKPATKKQKDQRNIFGMVTDFLSYVGEVIEIGFKGTDETKSAMNNAVSYNLKNAITGVSPNFTFNYPELLFSKGKLGQAFSILIDAVGSGQLKFSWTNLAYDKYKKTTDQLVLIVYCPELKQFVTLIGAAARSVLTYTMQMPLEFSGRDVHCYLSFIDETGRSSKGQYAGLIPVI